MYSYSLKKISKTSVKRNEVQSRSHNCIMGSFNAPIPDNMEVILQAVFSSAISWKEMFAIWNKFPKVPVDYKSALVQAMAWSGTGVMPLPGKMMNQFTDAYMRHGVSMSYGQYKKLDIEIINFGILENFQTSARHDTPSFYAVWPECPPDSTLTTVPLMGVTRAFRLSGTRLFVEDIGEVWPVSTCVIQINLPDMVFRGLLLIFFNFNPSMDK